MNRLKSCLPQGLVYNVAIELIDSGVTNYSSLLGGIELFKLPAEALKDTTAYDNVIASFTE